MGRTAGRRRGGPGGVEVTLYGDPDQNGIYDTVVGVSPRPWTDVYLRRRAAGGYVSSDGPRRLTQTGDPDGTMDKRRRCDHPRPGDTYVNTDFGYQRRRRQHDRRHGLVRRQRERD